MKFFAGLLSIACFSTCISASAVASQTHPSKAKAVAPAPKKAAAPAARVAPADEYFGRLKMSILGIRSTLKDLAQKADYDPSNPEQIVHMYSRVPTTSGRAKMHAAMDWLQKRYSKTQSLVSAAKAEVEAADKTAVAPAEAATTVPVPAASNAPAAQATNAPAPAAKPPACPY